ncbi:protein SPEAR3-like [Malania oleifera]|uniref:protein SPEAR3-like n=1 Tax=Malania oleifera TaxID=397392 RepID=UPI0025ADBCB3|nr:protein SPEAR3-like [Malania oleifera]
MGSSYFGEPNMGNERSSSSSSSSRKGKKGSNSDKPKQPQRGLGVAQLEKIRLHSQMGCSYLPSHLQYPPYPTTNLNQEDIMRMHSSTAYSSVPSSSCFSYSSSSSSTSSYVFQPNMMMGMGELERSNNRYGTANSQPSPTPRWNPGNGILETQHFAQPNMTRHFLNVHEEDSLQKKRKKDKGNSKGSSSQNSESSDSQEVDLELRLSL